LIEEKESSLIRYYDDHCQLKSSIF